MSAAGALGLGAGVIGSTLLASAVWKGATSGGKPVMKPFLVSTAVGAGAYAAFKGFQYLGLGGRGVVPVGHAIGGVLGAAAVIGAITSVGLLGASVVNIVRNALD